MIPGRCLPVTVLQLLTLITWTLGRDSWSLLRTVQGKEGRVSGYWGPGGWEKTAGTPSLNLQDLPKRRMLIGGEEATVFLMAHWAHDLAQGQSHGLNLPQGEQD